MYLAEAYTQAVAQHAAVADRFAREIGGIRMMYASVPGDGEVELAYCGGDRASKCRPPSPPAPISQDGIPLPRLRIHEFGLRRARNLGFFPQIGGQLWCALRPAIGCLSALMSRPQRVPSPGWLS